MLSCFQLKNLSVLKVGHAIATTLVKIKGQQSNFKVGSSELSSSSHSMPPLLFSFHLSFFLSFFVFFFLSFFLSFYQSFFLCPSIFGKGDRAAHCAQWPDLLVLHRPSLSFPTVHSLPKASFIISSFWDPIQQKSLRLIISN